MRKVMLLLAVVSSSAFASDYFAFLAVRYSDNSVKTFVQGPFNSKPRCDTLNQSTWDNTLTACGSCNAEQKFCVTKDDFPEIYLKTIRREKAAFPYVVATTNGRIIISGVRTSVAIEECQLLANKFRNNGYAEARCVLP